MIERLATLLVWTLVGWSAGFLALSLLPQPLQRPAQALAADGAPALALERLFGPPPAAQVAVAAPSDGRLRLLGIVAPRELARQTREGLALIAVGDQPPRAFKLGQRVDGELSLLAVEAHAVGLGSGGVVRMQLRLDPPAAPAQGQLPSVALSPAPEVAQMPAPLPPPSESGPIEPGSLPLREGVPKPPPRQSL